MNVRGHIDEIRFVDPLARNLDRAGTGRVPEGSSAYVRGWAFADDPPRAADAAIATIDGGEPLTLAYNQSRPDVVKALGLPAMLPVGFHGVLSLATLACGPHVLRIGLVDRAAGTSAEIEATVGFEIVDGAIAFPATQRLPHGEMSVNVDALTTFADRDARDALEGPIPRGATLTIRGWAVDRRYSTAASDVYANIDGTRLVRGIIGTTRADVASGLGMQTVARCGYVIRVDTATMTPGEHIADVRAIAADGERYAVSDAFAFVVDEHRAGR